MYIIRKFFFPILLLLKTNCYLTVMCFLRCLLNVTDDTQISRQNRPIGKQVTRMRLGDLKYAKSEIIYSILICDKKKKEKIIV